VTERLQCVILAGGLGTRIRSVAGDVPKALVPVAGTPFVDRQLELLAAGGVGEVVFCIGYGGAALREHVRDGAAHGLRVRYVDEGEQLRGTAGALRLALDEGVLAEAFFVLYGDSYLRLDYRRVWESFRESGMRALMTVCRNEDRWDASNAIVEDGRVVLYDKSGAHPRAGERRWIDYGLSVLTEDLIAERVSPGVVLDLADLFHELSVEGKLAAFEAEERFYEIGSPEGLADLERLLAAESL
jgi:NDP-sugar pyrophosphorylase family protein